MIDQIAISTLGVSAVALSQSSRQRTRRWACVCGLAAQPAWFYATWQAGQWGIFGVSIVYASAWGLGFYNHWIKRPTDACS